MEKEWDVDKPVNSLPQEIYIYFQREAKFLYKQLLQSQGVTLIPAPISKHHGHKIRQSDNPNWYRGLYWGRPNIRRDNHRSLIRRDRVLESLKRISEGKDQPYRAIRKHAPYHFDSILRNLIFQRLTEGYQVAETMPPINQVRTFFGIPVITIEDLVEADWD